MVDRRTAFGDLEGEGRFGGWWVAGKADVAALDHEVGNQSVEGRVVVGAAGAEGEEVLCLVSLLGYFFTVFEGTSLPLLFWELLRRIPRP